MAGLFFGGNRPGTVGFMGEINVMAKRSEAGTESATIYYVQVPALLRINIGSSSTTRGVIGYGIVGPAVDVKVGEDLGDITDTDEIESVDLSLVAGVGVEVSRFIIEARGTWGLRNVAKATGSRHRCRADSRGRPAVRAAAPRHLGARPDHRFGHAVGAGAEG